MFRTLTIKNYILIDEVKIDFASGFNVITGETGAGKSILVGALSLLSGQRADTQVLKDRSKKCVIEAEISVSGDALKSVFDAHDLDFETHTLIRREINANGKSRAFVNDTPVNLKVLEACSRQLFDLHSQHQNALIKDEAFRINIVDTAAHTHELLRAYQTDLEAFRQLEEKIKKRIKANQKLQQEYDFIAFQFQQLDDAQLQEGEQSDLEEELEQLNHAEDIKQALSGAYHYLNNEDNSIISMLIAVEHQLSGLSSYYKKAEDYLKRVQSSIIDLQDLSPDLESDAESVEYSPERIDYINDRLALLMELQRKHQKSSVEELIALRNHLDQQLQSFGNFEFEIEQEQKDLARLQERLNQTSSKLSRARQAAFSKIETRIMDMIRQLGMPKAQFKVQHLRLDEYTPLGQDDITFMFSANPGVDLDDIAKIASGGERSRIMLAIKEMLSEDAHLSTLILDEIDTGVSGEPAHKIGMLMQSMSKHRQLIVITHLPQIAAKGQNHYKVLKKVSGNTTTISTVEKLSKEQQILEIAGLLSGENISDAAIENAKELIAIK